MRLEARRLSLFAVAMNCANRLAKALKVLIGNVVFKRAIPKRDSELKIFRQPIQKTSTYSRIVEAQNPALQIREIEQFGIRDFQCNLVESYR